MITSLFKLNNKIPDVSYKTYPLENIDTELLERIFTSPIHGEDIITFEIFMNNKKISPYLVAPVNIKMNHNPIDVSHIYKYKYYPFLLKHDTFFPLYPDIRKSFFNRLNELKKSLLSNESLYFNMRLQKRKRGWRKASVRQFRSYLMGIDEPSENKILNYIELRSMKGEEEKRKLSSEVLDVIEKRINDDNFRFEMMFGIKSDDKQRQSLIKYVVNEFLHDYSYLNSLYIGDEIDANPRNSISDNAFEDYDMTQYLSISEIKSILDYSYEAEIIITNSENEESPQEETNQEIMQQPILQPSSTYALDTLPSLELLPVQIETNDDDVDMEIPERIKNALKRVRIVNDARSIKILDFKIGASLIKTTINIPKDKNLTDITKKVKDIKAALGTDSMSIDQGEFPDSVTFFIPRTNKQPIYLRSLLENDEFIKFAENNPLPFIIGVDPLNNPIYACLNKLTHVLTVGQTDSGKTSWVNQLILTLIMLRKPSELMFYLIDPKQVEFAPFKDFPQVAKVEDDASKANKLLEKLITEMENRYATMKESGVRNIGAYNQKNPNNKMPYIVTIVDEYSDLKMVNPTVDDLIGRLGQKARAAGIHLIIATQRPSVDVIEGKTKANLPSKFSLKLDSSASYKTIFDGKPPVEPTGKGHGVMKLLGQAKDYEQFQGAIISIDELETEETFDKIKKSFKGEKVEGIKIEKPEPEQPKEEPIIKLKKIIAETNESRIGKLRELMNMRTNVVKDLMYELESDGWLISPDNSNSGKWELNEECEELNKLRQMYVSNVEGIY